MSLMNLLQQIGGRLGLVKVVEAQADATGSGPAKIATRSVSIKDLAAEVRQEEVRVLAEAPAELEVPFAKVFEAAAIKPPAHGWTIERLGALLASDQYKTLDRTNTQKAVLGLLAAEKVPVEDLVKDAVSRDKAVDAYDIFTRKKLEDRTAARERRVGEILDQIKDLETEKAKLADETRQDQDRRCQWVDRKIAYEQDLARTVSYLLDQPVISITPQEPRPKI
jgi:hypothetical protein